MLFLSSCSPSTEPADLVVHNATIYTVDSAFTTCEAMAIRQGSIVATGSNQFILGRYSAAQQLDAGGAAIFPGLIDAHCHFLGYALGLRQVNLVGTSSFTDVLTRIQDFVAKNKKPADAAPQHMGSVPGWLLGRGWDQNDWQVKKYPTNRALDSLFPGVPVMLMRVDGHAALASSAALKLAGIDAHTKIKGGEILLEHGRPSGLLIDNAVALVKQHIPENDRAQLIAALIDAQANCLAQGLTTLDDAGLMKSDIDVIDEAQRSGQLKLRIYAMLSDSAENYRHYLAAGPYKTDRLHVCSFKFYADGALGSRGACLHSDYTDQTNWKGFLLSSPQHFDTCARLMAKHGFQMNTHCIGDSALSLLLDIYSQHVGPGKALRWRIEHAQVVRPNDLRKFALGIIPSVQPTHATSDMYWVKERLGERSKSAYAYHDLLGAAGRLALGTDFPVEDISPFKTFYAATVRTDADGFPTGGFQSENALTREETLRGMTIQAAYANFEEKEKGSLEKGKLADFVILDTDLMRCDPARILKAKVTATYIGGENVYQRSISR